MPSIEYWFLLHFENTNRFFGTSARVIKTLRKSLSGFEKKESYLKQGKWVLSLLEEDKMVTAHDRAGTLGHTGESFPDLWKGLDKFEEQK